MGVKLCKNLVTVIVSIFAALCVFNIQEVAAAEPTTYNETIVLSDEKDAIEYIEECIKNYETEIIFIVSKEGCAGRTAGEVMNSVLLNTPLYSEVSSASYYYQNLSVGIKFELTLAYKCTYEQNVEFNNALNAAIKSLNLSGKSEYQKVRAIHDYICNTVDYDFSYTKYTAYDALITGEAVCQGYAILFYRMCHEAGLECEYISGLGGGGGHAWNIVKIGDVYYNIDVTWDGQSDETRYVYFLTNETEFGDHQREDKYNTSEFHKAYPMAKDTWMDLNKVESAKGIDNVAEKTFSTTDGGTVSNQAVNNRPKILFFGSAKGCTNTSRTLAEIALGNFSDVDVIFVESNMASSSVVQNFITQYGNNNKNIKYSNSDTYYNVNIMWNYVNALGIDMQYFPLIVYIDGDNKIQYAEYSSQFTGVHVRNIVDGYLLKKGIASLSKTTAKICAKESTKLDVSVYGVQRNAQFFTWSSSDPSVATVDENGVVSGLKKGNATITCKVNDNIILECKLTVDRAKIADGFNLGYDGVWAYYKNGVVDTSYTGMASNSAGWWYIKNGILDRTYTGMASNAYGWWYIKNGKLDRTYTGMWPFRGQWIYINKGKYDYTYTGMAKKSDGWWYIKNGKLDTTYTGMAENAYGVWYMKNGKLDNSYTGMYVYNSQWIYVKNGKFDTTYTGMAKNSAGWWYIKNGKLDRTYTGFVTNSYATWYFKNGKLDTAFSGTVKVNGVTYTIKNGQLVK